MSEREDSMQSILAAACETACSVPYIYKLRSFPVEDGKFALYSVDNGEGKYLLGDEEVKKEEQDYENVVTVTEDSIEPQQNEEIIEKLQLIYQCILDGCSSLCNGTVNLTLRFNIQDDNIELLDSSELEITKETMKKTSRSTIANQELADYIKQVAAEPIPKGKCCSGGKNCTRAVYIVPKAVYLLTKVKEAFPEQNEAKILKLCKQQLDDPDETVLACVSCNSDYLAAAEIAAKAAEPEPPQFGLPPRQFQGLTTNELYGKRKLPMGMNPEYNKPYSFAINLYSSPYVLPPPQVRTPPQVTKERALSATAPVPKWAERLASRQSMRSTKAKVKDIHLEPPKHDTNVPEPEKIAYKSVNRAKKVYCSLPFDIGITDVKRKKRMHSKKVEFTDRFTFS